MFKKYGQISLKTKWVFEGRDLQVKNIENAGTGSPSVYLVEDRNVEAQRYFLYNIPKYEKIKEKLGFGRRFSTLYLYMQIVGDLMPSIRVDDLKPIIFHSKMEWKVCRLCFKSTSIQW